MTLSTIAKVFVVTVIVLMHADVAMYGQDSIFAGIIAFPGYVIDAVRGA